jgi:ADP-heptose:LPS heptosyltransferase
LKKKYLIRKRALGDVLWIEPVIRAIAKKYETVIVHTKFNALFNNFPLKNVIFKDHLSFLEKVLIRIEQIFGIKLFTINLDNSYENDPSIHFLNAYQKIAKVPLTQEYPMLYLTKQETENRIIPERYVILHIESFSNKVFRHIFGIDWQQVVAYLNDQGFHVIQIGVNVQPLKKVKNLKTTIREMISLIYHAEYFIGIDSGPSHIATSLGKRSMIFFGAINPETRHFSKFFNGLFLKQPCEYDGDYKRIFSYEPVNCARSVDPSVAQCCVYRTDHFITKVKELISQT